METAKPKTEEANQLDSFTWDNEGEDSFFGISGKETDEVEKIKEEIEEEPSTKLTPEKEEEQEENEKPEKKEEEEFEFEEKEKEEEEEPKGITFESKDLKNLFQYVELKEDEQIDREKFFELQDEEIEARVDATIKDFMEELGEDGKLFLQFKKAGGDSRAFFSKMSQLSSTPEVDIEKASNEDFDNILKYYYKNYEELEDSDIEEKLEWLAEGGKKEKYAKKYYEKIAKDREAIKQDMLQKQVDADNKRKNERLEFINSVKETAENTEEVSGFTFKKAEKTEIVEFITKPTIKVGDNRYITGLQNAINKIYKEDKQKLLLLAKLLKTDFDFTSIASKVQTEVTKKTKEKLSDSRSTSRPSSSGTVKKRNLADYFGN